MPKLTPSFFFRAVSWLIIIFEVGSLQYTSPKFLTRKDGCGWIFPRRGCFSILLLDLSTPYACDYWILNIQTHSNEGETVKTWIYKNFLIPLEVWHQWLSITTNPSSIMKSSTGLTKSSPIDWSNALIFTGTHLGALYGIIYISPWSFVPRKTILLTFFMWLSTGFRYVCVLKW